MYMCMSIMYNLSTASFTLLKEKYSFILIESFIVTINHDDAYIYSCLMSSLNVVIPKSRFWIGVSIGRYKY